MKRHFLLLIVLFYSMQSLLAQVNYAEWDGLLKKHVSTTGLVNYSGFKTDVALLDGVYEKLTAVNTNSLKTKNDVLSYWINLYNVATLKLLTSKYPLKSIQDLDGGKTWDVKRIKVGGQTLSLNDIENTKIRTLNDARIHFAVNCGAKSCPPLLNEAFMPDKLEGQLEKQAKSFINISTKRAGNVVTISKIFDWYAKDFGNVISFLNKYSTTKIEGSAKISYLTYDWSLNGK